MPATFVLVHGAWHGGWCYARVAERLRARGHHVFTPTLTGLGERVHLARNDITLTTHVTDIVNVLRYEDLREVVLCGHSYGGAVITGVVEAEPERIAALVYLDAFVPENGQSLQDLVPEAQRARQTEGAAANGGFVPPIPAAHFGVNESDRAYVDGLCVPQPLETFRERLALTGARERVAHKTYLRAGTYRSLPFDTARGRVAGTPGWFVEEIPSGHDVMLDAPDALAAALLAAAERAGLTAVPAGH
jgi:pimeloyl-ACP methyl ester carboxylesterase